MTIRCRRSPPDMLRVYRKFLELPGRTSYLAVRERLLQRPGFPPRINPLLALSDYIQRGEHSRAFPLAMQMAPDWLLSPRLHYFRAVVAEALDDEDQVALARFEMSACLDGLLATGDGSANRPYIVTYLSDVLDLLQLQQKTALRRRVLPEGDSLLDAIDCDDGRQRHFLHPPWTGKRLSLRSMNRSLAPITA